MPAATMRRRYGDLQRQPLTGTIGGRDRLILRQPSTALDLSNKALTSIDECARHRRRPPDLSGRTSRPSARLPAAPAQRSLPDVGVNTWTSPTHVTSIEALAGGAGEINSSSPAPGRMLTPSRPAATGDTSRRRWDETWIFPAWPLSAASKCSTAIPATRIYPYCGAGGGVTIDGGAGTGDSVTAAAAGARLLPFYQHVEVSSAAQATTPGCFNAPEVAGITTITAAAQAPMP